jgi:hypothetical protein
MLESRCYCYCYCPFHTCPFHTCVMPASSSPTRFIMSLTSVSICGWPQCVHGVRLVKVARVCIALVSPQGRLPP